MADKRDLSSCLRLVWTRIGAAIIAELAAMASGVGDQIQDTGRIVDGV
jgi:hypothetical protein